eukprot:scaffold369_cov177-Ochromonas_danica.AAC.3
MVIPLKDAALRFWQVRFLDQIEEFVKIVVVLRSIDSVFERYRQGRRVRDSDEYSLTIEIPWSVCFQLSKTHIVKIASLDDDAYDAIEFLLELKPPFTSLYHATPDGPKGQLVSQLLGLWEMSSKSLAPTKSKKRFSTEEYDSSCEGEIELQLWYARHNGFLALTKENIDNNQHSCSYKIV